MQFGKNEIQPSVHIWLKKPLRHKASLYCIMRKCHPKEKILPEHASLQKLLAGQFGIKREGHIDTSLTVYKKVGKCASHRVFLIQKFEFEMRARYSSWKSTATYISGCLVTYVCLAFRIVSSKRKVKSKFLNFF